MENVLIRPIAEADIDRLITNAGGRRTRADNGKRAVRMLAHNQRMGHEDALALASAYAVAEGVECVLWRFYRRYAWS
jgi:hypothetical protein